MKIGCSGPVDQRSGIGVVQAHLYPHLVAAGHELFYSGSRDVGSSLPARVRGLLRGWRPAVGPLDVYLSVVPPLPIGLTVPVTSVVHDLRWIRTRSKVGRLYRSSDLRRTVSRSEALICISETTREDLIRFDPRASAKSLVQWLGPGLIPEGSFKLSDSGILMLVGGAKHKRNEYAAEALTLGRPNWIRGIVGIGISPEVRAKLSSCYPCEWFSNVSDLEMIALYRRAQYFLMLGTDEGFGLPFIEALSAGCQVIAANHTLPREILGAAGTFVSCVDPVETAQQLLTAPCIPVEVRAARASEFSWASFGKACENELVRIFQSCPS